MDHALELTRQAEATHFWFEGFRAFIRPVLADLAAGRRDLRLIDCGCGTGFNLALLEPYGRVAAFDLTPRGVREARALGKPVARADIRHIPFRSHTFDVATSFDVLQSVPGDREAVREMARILRPGGVIVLTMAALEILRGDHSVSWDEVQRYTPGTARQLVEAAGLRPERISFLFASLFPLIVTARAAQRALRPFRGLREDSDIRVPPAAINHALTKLVLAEAALARRWQMPIGSSLLVVARKA